VRGGGREPGNPKGGKKGTAEPGERKGDLGGRGGARPKMQAEGSTVKVRTRERGIVRV